MTDTVLRRIVRSLSRGDSVTPAQPWPAESGDLWVPASGVTVPWTWESAVVAVLAMAGVVLALVVIVWAIYRVLRATDPVVDVEQPRSERAPSG